MRPRRWRGVVANRIFRAAMLGGSTVAVIVATASLPASGAGGSVDTATHPAAGIQCPDGGPIAITQARIEDEPGGATSPRAAVEEFLAIRIPPLADAPLQVQPSGDVEVEQAPSPIGAVDARFRVRFIGDSWHVVGWAMCGSVQSQLMPAVQR